MENIAKALLIVAAVMIGALLLANYTTSMNRTTEFTDVYLEKMSKEEISKFNSEFTKYAGLGDKNTKSGMNINKCLYIDADTNFDTRSLDYIKVNINFQHGTDYNDFIQNFYTAGKFDYNRYHETIFEFLNKYFDNTIDLSGGSVDNPVVNDKTLFSLVINRYSNDGKVSEITFTELEN